MIRSGQIQHEREKARKEEEKQRQREQEQERHFREACEFTEQHFLELSVWAHKRMHADPEQWPLPREFASLNGNPPLYRESGLVGVKLVLNPVGEIAVLHYMPFVFAEHELPTEAEARRWVRQKVQESSPDDWPPWIQETASELETLIQ